MEGRPTRSDCHFERGTAGVGYLDSQRATGLQGQGEVPSKAGSGSEGCVVCLILFPMPGPAFSFLSKVSAAAI